jgi:hypothetical protein
MRPVMWLIIVIVLCHYREFFKWLKMRRLKKERLRHANALWLKAATRFSEWKSKRYGYSWDNPQYQWHVQHEASAFKAYLDLKPTVSDYERKYLGRLTEFLEENARVEEPPE